MARSAARRPLSEQPIPAPASVSVAVAPVVGTGQHIVPTEAEDEERRVFIEGLFLAGAPTSRIIQLACAPPRIDSDGVKRGGLGITKQLARHYLAELRSFHALFASEADNTRRTDQLARLRNDMMRMRSEKKVPYATVGTHEKLIAEIEGNLAPRRLQVELHAVPDALAAAVAGWSADDVERMVAEELEREKRLAAIETTASPIE